MKYTQQFFIICVISFVGELLNMILPFKIPGNIYGMILMFLLLLSGIIKIHQVKETGKFLVDIMPILFIPSAVGIMTEIDEIKKIWWQVLIITITTTFIVMIISGRVTQMIIRHKKGNDKKIHKKK